MRALVVKFKGEIHSVWKKKPTSLDFNTLSGFGGKTPHLIYSQISELFYNGEVKPDPHKNEDTYTLEAFDIGG